MESKIDSLAGQLEELKSSVETVHEKMDDYEQCKKDRIQISPLCS